MQCRPRGSLHAQKNYINTLYPGFYFITTLLAVFEATGAQTIVWVRSRFTEYKTKERIYSTDLARLKTAVWQGWFCKHSRLCKFWKQWTSFIKSSAKQYSAFKGCSKRRNRECGMLWSCCGTVPVTHYHKDTGLSDQTSSVNFHPLHDCQQSSYYALTIHVMVLHL